MAGVAGGIFTVLSGIMNGSAVSWFAALIVDQYTQAGILNGSGRSVTGTRMVFGHAIWLGWGCMILYLLSGIQNDR